MDVGESTNDVGESTLDVGELTVGETTRRRNDRKPSNAYAGGIGFFAQLLLHWDHGMNNGRQIKSFL